jgi:hypothetical protein
MKKLLLYLIIFIPFMASCNLSEKKEIKSQVFLVPRDKIKVFIDSFIKISEDKNLIYEIYIDKITSWEYDIVLYSGEKSLSEKITPEIITEVSGIKFNIYSGIEHYFKAPGDTTTIDDEPRKEGAPNGNYWIITEKDGKFEIIKDSWALPYYSMPNRMKFIPPEIKEDI